MTYLGSVDTLRRQCRTASLSTTSTSASESKRKVILRRSPTDARKGVVSKGLVCSKLAVGPRKWSRKPLQSLDRLSFRQSFSDRTRRPVRLEPSRKRKGLRRAIVFSLQGPASDKLTTDKLTTEKLSEKSTFGASSQEHRPHHSTPRTSIRHPLYLWPNWFDGGSTISCTATRVLTTSLLVDHNDHNSRGEEEIEGDDGEVQVDSYLFSNSRPANSRPTNSRHTNSAEVTEALDPLWQRLCPSFEPSANLKDPRRHSDQLVSECCAPDHRKDSVIALDGTDRPGTVQNGTEKDFPIGEMRVPHQVFGGPLISSGYLRNSMQDQGMRQDLHFSTNGHPPPRDTMRDNRTPPSVKSNSFDSLEHQPEGFSSFTDCLRSAEIVADSTADPANTGPAASFPAAPFTSGAWSKPAPGSCDTMLLSMSFDSEAQVDTILLGQESPLVGRECPSPVEISNSIPSNSIPCTETTTSSALASFVASSERLRTSSHCSTPASNPLNANANDIPRPDSCNLIELLDLFFGIALQGRVAESAPPHAPHDQPSAPSSATSHTTTSHAATSTSIAGQQEAPHGPQQPRSRSPRNVPHSRKATLPTVLYDATKGKLAPEAAKCSICLDDFQHLDKRSFLPCLHSFHKHCISRWLHRSSYCPICLLDIRKLLKLASLSRNGNCSKTNGLCELTANILSTTGGLPSLTAPCNANGCLPNARPNRPSIPAAASSSQSIPVTSTSHSPRQLGPPQCSPCLISRNPSQSRQYEALVAETSSSDEPAISLMSSDCAEILRRQPLTTVELATVEEARRRLARSESSPSTLLQFRAQFTRADPRSDHQRSDHVHNNYPSNTQPTRQAVSPMGASRSFGLYTPTSFSQNSVLSWLQSPGHAGQTDIQEERSRMDTLTRDRELVNQNPNHIACENGSNSIASISNQHSSQSSSSLAPTPTTNTSVSILSSASPSTEDNPPHQTLHQMNVAPALSVPHASRKSTNAAREQAIVHPVVNLPASDGERQLNLGRANKDISYQSKSQTKPPKISVSINSTNRRKLPTPSSSPSSPSSPRSSQLKTKEGSENTGVQNSNSVRSETGLVRPLGAGSSGRALRVNSERRSFESPTRAEAAFVSPPHPLYAPSLSRHSLRHPPKPRDSPTEHRELGGRELGSRGTPAPTNNERLGHPPRKSIEPNSSPLSVEDNRHQENRSLVHPQHPHHQHPQRRWSHRTSRHTVEYHQTQVNQIQVNQTQANQSLLHSINQQQLLYRPSLAGLSKSKRSNQDSPK